MAKYRRSKTNNKYFIDIPKSKDKTKFKKVCTYCGTSSVNNFFDKCKKCGNLIIGRIKE